MSQRECSTGVVLLHTVAKAVAGVEVVVVKRLEGGAERGEGFFIWV